MRKSNVKPRIKSVLQMILIALLGCFCVVFAVLYIETFNNGFWFDYSIPVTAIIVSIISTVTILTIVFFAKSKSFIYKLFFITIILILFTAASLYFLKLYGFLDKINSVGEFRVYINSFGSYAVVLFILIQFLQVVILPIPSFITVGAGVLLFGPLKGAFFSCVGIILGSILAYYVGKFFGVKVAEWLVGADNLKKWLKFINGKDKIVLTFMFLFPFFPDDVLCFVAGITTISPIFFVVMIIITRIITIFISSYSLNNSIIPYNTWWGVLLWVIFFILTATFTIFIYKKGDKIERFFTKKKKSIKN